ncbi:MAG: hypothetical protein D6806_11645 [Deltaproteobacteria bacterium]|nr:MAG: hypothetical protein D6806_11645 [Deltaproteobacteria bacterium]
MKLAVAFSLACVFQLSGCCNKQRTAEAAANPKAAEAAAQCKRWLDGASKDPGIARSADVFEACAGIFSSPKLKRLLAHQQALPADRRMPVVAEALRQTYCARLKEPVAELCRGKPPPHPLRLRQEIWQLLWYVLVYELGPEQAASIYGPMLLADLARRPVLSVGKPMGLEAKLPVPEKPAGKQ